MCGIAGFISLAPQYQQQHLQDMANSLRHRGPDAEGFYLSKNQQVGFAHRRLSVLDLSAAANQPMYSANGRYCIVFNGEIYNFHSLKNSLSDKGASLKTSSDTELLLELFAQMGPDCFAILDGMFAFAIHDLQENVVTLCRDRVGIKPLFYYQHGGSVIFASELKAIQSLTAGKWNPAALPYFLHLGFIPAPFTIYQNTFKFAAGYFVQIKVDGAAALPIIEEEQLAFWRPQQAIQTELMTDEILAKKKLKQLLYAAVEKQLVADVPVGTFLSGGIDSSLVTAIAASVGGSKKINTFSIGFQESAADESVHALKVANFLGTYHHQSLLQQQDVVAMMEQLLPSFDEPFADSSAFALMAVSRLAKQQVTVALSGDGGDELFHGYGAYQWAERLATPILKLVKAPLSAAAKFGSSRYQRIGNMLAYTNAQQLPSHIFSQEQYFFFQAELQHLLVKPSVDFGALNALPVMQRKLAPAAQQAYWDFVHYLPDDLLTKVDRASMQYGLECRVPLLDNDLIHFAFNLDEKLKVKNGVQKYLLKQVLYDLVPSHFFDRPKKGFSIPLSQWLKKDLHYLLEQYTSDRVILKYGIVKIDQVKALKQKYFKGADYLFHRLWLMVVLHWWLEKNATSTQLS